MGLEWADEQTLRWPIQDLQPWANRAASDGPMKGQRIRAIWVCTCSVYFHGQSVFPVWGLYLPLHSLKQNVCHQFLPESIRNIFCFISYWISVLSNQRIGRRINVLSFSNNSSY